MLTGVVSSGGTASPSHSVHSPPTTRLHSSFEPPANVGLLVPAASAPGSSLPEHMVPLMVLYLSVSVCVPQLDIQRCVSRAWALADVNKWWHLLIGLDTRNKRLLASSFLKSWPGLPTAGSLLRPLALGTQGM